MTNQPPVLSAEEVWRRYDRMEARLTAPLSERMLDLAGIATGMRVLDLATGRGEPALRAAHRVGKTGSVFGVDLSESMLQMARERETLEGISNLKLRAMNVELLDGIPIGHFHAALMRWGLMYLDSPVAALSAVRRTLLPGGVFVAAVWGEPERVQYFTLPRLVLGRMASLPPIDMERPGTFRYSDVRHLQHDFATAGFAIRQIEEMEVDVMEADSADKLIEWTRIFGLSRLLKDLPEEIQQAWEAQMLIEAEGLRRNGVIRLNGMTRIVVASTAGYP